MRERKLGPRTVKLHVSALRFFFVKTLKRPYLLEDIPFPKVPRRLPVILTTEEVARLIVEACGVRPYQIVDAPEWVLTDRFDVEARAPIGADPADTDAMLQRLLEDRFGLLVRYEMRRMPTYALEMDRQRRLGPGLRWPSARCESVAAQRKKPQSPSAQTALRDAARVPACMGSAGTGLDLCALRSCRLAAGNAEQQRRPPSR